MKTTHQNADYEIVKYRNEHERKEIITNKEKKRVKALNRMLLFFCSYLELLIGSKNKEMINDGISLCKSIIWLIKKYIYIYGFAIDIILKKTGITLLLISLICIALRKYKEYLDDREIRIFDMSMICYAFFIFSSLLFAANKIKAYINVNIFGIYLLLMVGYVVLRSVVN